MKKLLVILDNGHGSNTHGKCSPDKSIYEWKWTREITSMLHESLMMEGIESVILVPEDKDISLKERVRRANNLYVQAKKSGKEAILISVHINAAGGDGKWKNATGWSVWIANNASQKSQELAELLYNEAEKRNLQGNRVVPPCHYWTANFTIVTDTKCPAVLTENLFQDNKQECEYLLSDIGKQTIAQLHVAGIKQYIQT